MSDTCLHLGLCAAAGLIGFGVVAPTQAAIVVIDDFNVNEGHFSSGPTSGSNANIAAASTADRITAGTYEGPGSQQLVVNTNDQGASARLRHLSGGGTPANNTPFATTAGADGWIGFAIKTSAPGWSAQLYIEPAATGPATGSNGSVPKNLIADGDWHIYEWNLDDNSGGPDGWGTIAGIATGVATVGNGNHTIDSLVLRTTTGASSPASSTFDFDYLAISSSGRLSLAVPEPASAGLVLLGSMAAGFRRRRRA